MLLISLVAHKISTNYFYFVFYVVYMLCTLLSIQVLQKGAGDAVLSRFIRYFGSDLLVSIEDHGGMLEDNIGIPIVLRM